jgi:hypothetical protein
LEKIEHFRRQSKRENSKSEATLPELGLRAIVTVPVITLNGENHAYLQ